MDCSSIVLAGITQDCTPSLGGIKAVYLIPYSDVTGVTVEDDKISAISLVPEKKFLKYEFRKNTGSLTSTLTVDETAGTNYVANELALVFTKMETAKRLEIAALSIGHCVAVVEDSNGLYWYLGKDDYVAATAGTGVTGTAKGDQNAYTITLATDSETYPFELADTAIKTVLGQA